MNDRQLDRKLTPLNVWSLAFGCIIGWSAFVMPGTVFLKNAGPLGTLIAMEIATLIMLIISYNYSYMIRRFPVSGGQFIYAKMAFGKKHGFICAWFLGLCYLSVIPLNATALNLIFRAVFGNTFQFGFHYNIDGYDVYLGEIMLAAAALIIFAFIGSLGVHFTGKIQTFLVMVLLGGILIVLGGVILSPNASTSNLQPMFHPENADFHRSVISQIFCVAATAPQSFVGFDTVPQLSEESKFAHDGVKVIMDTSIMCGCFVYISLTLIAASVVPSGYSSWVSYIDDLPNISGYTGIPTLASSYAVLGKAGLFFIVASVVAAMLTGIIGFYIATSRLLYSMARDGMIPSWFRTLNKNNVPVNAVLFCTCVAISTSLFGRVILGWIFDMASLGGAISFGYTSLAARKYAIREHRTDIVIFGSMGFVFSMFLAFILLVPVPGLDCSLYTEAYMCLIAWIIMGAIFFYKTRK